MSKQKKPREKFRFYIDWMEPLMDLPNNEVGILFTGILKYAFHNEIIEVPDHLSAAFKIIRFQVDKSLEHEKVNLYVVKLSDSKESFFKIGIAHDIAKRIQSFIGVGYSAERFTSFEIKFNDREGALNFEKRLHDKLDEFKYFPKKKFGGQFECFSTTCFDEIDLAILKLKEELKDE